MGRLGPLCSFLPALRSRSEWTQTVQVFIEPLRASGPRALTLSGPLSSRHPPDGERWFLTPQLGTGGSSAPRPALHISSLFSKPVFFIYFPSLPPH